MTLIYLGYFTWWLPHPEVDNSGLGAIRSLPLSIRKLPDPRDAGGGWRDQLVNGWLMMKIPYEWLARLNPTDDENLRFYGFSLALGVFGVWFGA